MDIRVDNTAPTVEYVYNTYGGGNVTLFFSVTDIHSGAGSASVKVDGTTVTKTFDGTYWKATAATGAATSIVYSITAIDSAGNGRVLSDTISF